MSTTSEKIRGLQLDLNDRFPQRQDAIEACLIALVTKEHAFLLGPPGTAKSMLVRDIFGAVSGAEYFEVLMSKNRPDAAVMGPYDMQLLRSESSFVRKDAGFLTTAHFAFIDEAGKMSPTVGHDMLAALNERIKHEVKGGRSAHHIPLLTAIAASNEHPATASDDAAALWDRLLLRAPVEYLASGSDFAKMLTARHVPLEPVLTLDEVNWIHEMEIPSVTVTQGTLDALHALRKTLTTDGFVISDRRWRASVKAIQATAWLRGSDATEPEDLAILRLIVWDQLETFDKIRRTIMKVTSPLSEEVLELRDGFDEIKANMESRADKSKTERLTHFTTEAPKLTEIRSQLKAKAKKTQNQTLIAEMESFSREVSTWYRDTMNSLGIGGMNDDD